MRHLLAVAVLATIGGALPIDSATEFKPSGPIKLRQCSREGTLRTFQFSDESPSSPLFCECLPGFDGRYCEKRVCRHGRVEVVALEEEYSETGGWEYFATTECKCRSGYRGPSCEEQIERKPVPWTTVIAFLEPIVFFVIFLIPCCCALQMAREFVAPLFDREFYSPLHYDPEQGMMPVKTTEQCCPYRRISNDSAPPAYSNIYCAPQQPTVSLMTDLRQPIYTTAKIYPHV